VRQVRSDVSERRACHILHVARAALHPRSPQRGKPARAVPTWIAHVHGLIQQYPTFGYRRIWALLRFREGIMVNHKAVYRVLKRRGWLVHQRPCTPRPRVQGRVSQAAQSNERWAMDVTHVPCGPDGWAHLAAVIDCHDREVIGYEFALRGRAKEAERAIEAACLARFGTLRPVGAPMLRSDNGLIFQSRRFRQACRDYRLRQEFITPYTPEQNGIIERFFRSLKEECVWQHQFDTFAEARRRIRDWIHWYNDDRPHQTLGYLSPRQYRARQLAKVG
jgi:putative transposase